MMMMMMMILKNLHYGTFIKTLLLYPSVTPTSKLALTLVSRALTLLDKRMKGTRESNLQFFAWL